METPRIDMANRRLGQLYEVIAEEEDVRVCTDISDDACHYVPFNFFAIVVANTLSKLGDELANPKTVLAWVMNFVGAPLYLVGLLVPIRESGSLLPQLAIAAYVRRMAVRKWVWVLGSIVQCAAVAGIGVVAWALTGAAAGWAVVGLLVLFSLARGMCSVSHKDVLGKTIPKTRRGRLSGIAGSASGIVALAVGLYFLYRGNDTPDPAFFGMLVVGAGLLWLLAAGAFSLIQEFAGATEGGGKALAEAFKRLSLLRDDPAFGRFVLVRALMLCSALTAPYYIILATGGGEPEIATLGLFILANGLAATLSAPIWGRMADTSSRNVMMRGALMAAILGILAFAVDTFIPEISGNAFLFAGAFFVLGVAHSGVRLGRKTYVVDLADGNRRTDYVAVSNTVIGAALLFSGVIGVLAGTLSPAGVILIFSLFGLAGVALAARLPEAEG